jgi:hypothetical protein
MGGLVESPLAALAACLIVPEPVASAGLRRAHFHFEEPMLPETGMFGGWAGWHTAAHSLQHDPTATTERRKRRHNYTQETR